MNRRTFLHATTAAGLLPLARAAAPTVTDHDRLARVRAAALSMQRRDWEQGVLSQAFFELGDHTTVLQLARSAAMLQTPDGRMGVVVSGSVTDPAMGGEAWLSAARRSSSPSLLASVQRLEQWIVRDAPRSSSGLIYHVFSHPQYWSDGFYGAPPFLAALGHFDQAVQQIDGFWLKLWRPESQMLAHISEEGHPGFVDGRCWGGGNGWAAAGLARVIALLPTSHSAARTRLIGYARQLLDGCLRHQRPDGLFHDVLDQPTTFVETNTAQMLAYAIYRGLRDSWLPASYRTAADRMRQAAERLVDADGFVTGASSTPNFDRPGVSTEAQAFHLLMESVA